MAQRDEAVPEPTRQEGISLDELAQAFAQVMGVAPQPQAGVEPLSQPAAVPQVPVGVEAVEQPSDAVGLPDAADSPVADGCPVSPRSIFEAMLFVGNQGIEPLSAARAAELMRGVAVDEISALVDELNGLYAARGCPYHIVHEGAGYRLTLTADFSKVRDRFYGRVREARLSQAAIDVLAIVAYQQPLTAEQVGARRGKPSSHVLAQLVHRGLLRIQRQPGNRRITQYFTTDRFLRLFGLSCLGDLPQSEELDRQ